MLCISLFCLFKYINGKPGAVSFYVGSGQKCWRTLWPWLFTKHHLSSKIITINRSHMGWYDFQRTTEACNSVSQMGQTLIFLIKMQRLVSCVRLDFHGRLAGSHGWSLGCGGSGGAHSICSVIKGLAWWLKGKTWQWHSFMTLNFVQERFHNSLITNQVLLVTL